ncbi:MAG: TonB family protein [Bacteroidetes bacterium]|nr:TonB family protein [Bacteroidota bacterium]
MASFLAMLFCQLLWSQYSADTLFTHVSKMPCFGDCASQAKDVEAQKKCSDRALVQFISRHLEYPEEAKSKKIEGTVYVNFVIDETGLVKSPTLLTDIGSGCGEAALAVIKAMPTWEPGMQDGQPVNVKLNLPIQFSLRNAEQALAERFTITWGDIVGDTVSIEQLQRNLPFSVYVRGPEGDSRYVDELAFTYANRGKRKTTATSRGGISDDLVAIVEKSKNGGKFIITASVQDGGQFISISRAFYVAD